jgi:hypothetical protein
MEIGKQNKYSYTLGINLSLDTHIDDRLAFFQNGTKLWFMFMKCKQTRKLKNEHILTPQA